jgi:hypothetical protein
LLAASVSVLMLGVSESVASASEGSPYGSFDQAYVGPDGAHLQGWVLDPDSADPVDIHVYVDGAFVAADKAQFAYPGAGNSGFFPTVPLQPGFHSVCIYALSIGLGDNTLIGCRTAFRGTDPFGDVNTLELLEKGPTLRGWVLEPDTFEAVKVHVYVDGAFAGAGVADKLSPDVVAAHPGWGGVPSGAQHRFEIPIHMPSGQHTVCAYGINVGPGSNGLLACKLFSQTIDPVGALDIAVANTLRNTVRVHGWAFDPETGDPVQVHFYADGQPVGALTANRYRPDVGALFHVGDSHGYAGPIPVPRNAATLCAYGINLGTGTNQLLGCLPIDWTGNPIGELRQTNESCGDGTRRVTMWAIDPDTLVHLTIDIYERQPDGPSRSLRASPQQIPAMPPGGRSSRTMGLIISPASAAQGTSTTTPSTSARRRARTRSSAPTSARQALAKLMTPVEMSSPPGSTR